MDESEKTLTSINRTVKLVHYNIDASGKPTCEGRPAQQGVSIMGDDIPFSVLWLEHQRCCDERRLSCAADVRWESHIPGAGV